MSWRQLVVEPAAQQLAAVEQWLDDAGALALCLQDAGDEPLLEPAPGATPLWRHTRIVALFDEHADLTTIRSRLELTFGEAILERPRIHTLRERVWELEWRREFHARRFGRRLWVAPADRLERLPAHAVAVILEPGLAFGTGSHPSTALCLNWLDARNLQGKRVLDYGCGSGILGIAAARLGASAVTATDIDPQALQAARDNIARNSLTQVDVIEAAMLPPAHYDVVLANILASTLASLAETLTALTLPGADLVLSGLLVHQAEQVRACYQQWFDFETDDRSGDWCLLHGHRRREPVN